MCSPGLYVCIPISSEQASSGEGLGLLSPRRAACLACVGRGSRVRVPHFRLLLPAAILWPPPGSGTVSDQDND